MLTNTEAFQSAKTSKCDLRRQEHKRAGCSAAYGTKINVGRKQKNIDPKQQSFACIVETLA